MAVRQCGYCQGKGLTTPGKCFVCKGTGWVTMLDNVGQCGDCKGRGQTIHGKCKVCLGTGWVGVEKISLSGHRDR